MSVTSPQSLYAFVDHPRLECLNQSVDHTVTAAFRDVSLTAPYLSTTSLSQEAPEEDSTYLESDTDEQLLIHFPFRQPVKIHSLIIQSGAEGSAPRRIKLFVNSPTIGFSEADESNGTQSFDLTSEMLKEAKPIPLRFVKFQNVNCLSLFVESNQEDTETTQIKWIKLMGYSGEVMDVASIKKTEES